MELLEYQAKELFRIIGIPILPSQTIKDSRKIKQLQIPYPVVLKSQVRAGGRGKLGGVRFVANTIDAIAAARTIFNLSILGEYPEVILAEAHYNAEREFFLAIVLDYELQCPVLLGSANGGMNVNALLANVQQVVVDTEFSLFHARRLAASMGLSGQLICSVSDIIAKMYRLFCEKDLELIEINPLGVNTRGELMALDGKITISDRALARQPIIETLDLSKYQQADRIDRNGWHWLDWHNNSGKIAVICNGSGLASLTWDLLSQNKLNPACGVIIEDELVDREKICEFYRSQLEQILPELMLFKKLKAILINICGTETLSKEIVGAVNDYLQPYSDSDLSTSPESYESAAASAGSERSQNTSVKALADSRPKLIIHLLKSDLVYDLQAAEGIYLFDNLESSISKAVEVVKSS